MGSSDLNQSMRMIFNVNSFLRLFITVIWTKNIFVKVKVKVKFTLEQATKAQMGVEV